MLKRTLHEVLPAKLIMFIQQFRALIEPNGSESGEISDFHFTVIRPEILSRWRPRVVEIGVLNGAHSWLLLGATIRKLGTLTSIDPKPGTAIGTVMKLYPFGRIMATTSLKALTDLVAQKFAIDIAIIDGDHNHYTVINELRLVAQILSPNGIIYLHDVGWPYGRRDMYYVPDRIPENERHSFATRGMSKGVSQLLDEGGRNSEVYNALYEGGPKNGVLTAIEDFIIQSEGEWTFEIRHEQHGLGILRRS